MGRPTTQREPVRRAIFDVLASGPVLARDALAEVVRRTGAARQTIERHGRELYDVESPREPGERVPTRWWRLRPEVMGIDPEILTTAPDDPSAPKVMTTGPRARKSTKTQRNGKRNTTGGRPSKRTGTYALSLLDGDQRRASRETAVRAFAQCLERWAFPLNTINLTTTNGSSSNADDIHDVAERVATWGGGIWLVPHTAVPTDHEHYHGLIVNVEPSAVIDAWSRATGAASRDGQYSEPIYELKGWLDYCRRQPGFDLLRVVASGPLQTAWAGALTEAGQPIPKPRLGATNASSPRSAAQLADLDALQRIVVGLNPQNVKPYTEA